MSNKYIVKNCPCIYKSYRSDYDCDYDGPCEDCTDCLTKELIKKIKDSQIEIGACSMVYADDILKLFDIERCE